MAAKDGSGRFGKRICLRATPSGTVLSGSSIVFVSNYEIKLL